MKIIISNFFRNKKNIVYALLIGILISMSMLISIYYNTINNYLNNDIYKNFENNTLLVIVKNDDHSNTIISHDKIKNELSSMDHVVGTFDYMSHYNGLYSKQFKTKNLSGLINLYAATNDGLPNIIYGEKFPDYNDNYIICPESFFPTDKNIKSLSRNDNINLKRYLNDYITFDYSSFELNKKYNIKYKLIGIYENNTFSYDENVCFVNEKSLLDVYTNERSNSDPEVLDLNNTENIYYVQVDRIENIDKVAKQLQESNYYVEPTYTVNNNYFSNIFNNIRIFSISLYCILFFMIVFIIFKSYKDDNKFYNLLTYLGYSNKSKKRMYIYSNIVLGTISSAVALFFAIMFEYIIKIVLYFKPFIFEKRKIIVDYNVVTIVILATFLLIFLLSAILMNFNNKEKI